ncbi:MAG TPA: hypothetical protein VM580_27595, partial [Labilithrix sp.]|nr:hypothetical protein [Labilithrix sp.]
TDCLARGHATGILDWALDRDPNITLAYMTHARDHVIGEFFMGMTANQFQAAVITETNHLLAAHPGRFFRFVVPGSRHTLMLGMDLVPAPLVQTVLAMFGPLALTGESVSPKGLFKWTLGGLRETGITKEGIEVSGYEWLQILFANPSITPDVLQIH